MTDRYTDTTGTCCPRCQSTDRISYVVIPRAQLNFIQDDENHTHHFGPQRDYICQNCDQEWLMPEDES